MQMNMQQNVYRSKLDQRGMLPFLIDGEDLPLQIGDYLFIPQIKKAIEDKLTENYPICCKRR